MDQAETSTNSGKVTPGFVHLRVHSEFSLIDSLINLKGLIAQTEQLAMPAVALTDHNNLFGLVKFYSGCLNAGIKPLVGCDLMVSIEQEQATPLTVLVQDELGLANLREIVSELYRTERWLRGQIGIDLLREHGAGLIALSGGLHGAVGQALVGRDPASARGIADTMQEIFSDRFYLELQRTGRDQEALYLDGALHLADSAAIPVVATNDVRFLKSDDFEAHETRVCIHDSRMLDDPRRPRNYSDQQYLRSPDEMTQLFADIPEALENTMHIARRCNAPLQLGTYYLPEYPVPEGMNREEYLAFESDQGLKKRLQNNPAPEHIAPQVYQDRLAFELDIINQMGFAGYFLIVMEFISWAKQNAVPVGPGRGSGAGSLVAYALGITDLDPLQYDLLFERFLNPERVSMPDFDVDFCMEGRDSVIEHVADTYGHDAVAQIITYGTMAAKAVVRDVARVQGKPYSLADRLSKLIPFEVGMTLHKAMEQEEALRSFVAQDDEAAEIMDMAYQLEGIVRNVGRHAGGVVIAPGKLTNYVPLYAEEGSSSIVTQFDKDDVELAGLVKFDFLGLRTLTIIDWALRTINRQREAQGEAPVIIEQLPLDDEATFKLLKKAETTAVFQLESRGMKDLIKRLQPDSLEEVIALVALFRPGPLQSGMVDDFIDRKHGRARVEYPHPDLQEVLSNTYGVILYQEQVMQIAQVLAGFSLGQADVLRRAMGKKKAEEMARQRALFAQGAAERGVEEATATHIFDLMEKFAGYGFNKSHSAAYGLVSYQTAWLKAHFPAEFMAAVLSADMQNTDKIVILVEEVRQMQLTLRPPDVNRGDYHFTVAQGDIVYGLGAIKGVGHGPVEALIAARGDGAFVDLFDFCRRVDAKQLNKRVLEALIRSGAMDGLCLSNHADPEEMLDNDIDARRARLLATIPAAVRGAEQEARNTAAGIGDMFGGPASATDAAETVVANVPPLSRRARLDAEKDTLGLYLTGHPIEDFEDELRRFVPRRLADLVPNGSEQRVAGLVVGVRTMRSRRGGSFAIVTLDDRSARIDVTVFSDVLEKYGDRFEKDHVLVVVGAVAMDDYSDAPGVRASEIYSLKAARLRYADQLRITVRDGQCGAQLSETLCSVLTPHRALGCSVSVEYQAAAAQGQLRLGEEWRVDPCDELLDSLRAKFGADSVALDYGRAG